MSKNRSKAPAKRSSTNDFSGFTLLNVKPKTEAQKDVFDAFDEGYNLFLHGVAGTGKSFISLYLAFREMLKNPIYEKVIIVRSSVPSRDVGFLPGTLEEKMAVYELPYMSMTKELFRRGDAYEVLKTKNKIQFLSSSYLRGTTLQNCIVILDEVQNFSGSELDTAISRVGDNCKLLVCGDIDQNDLNKKANDQTGLPKFFKIVQEMEEFDLIEFTAEDIVRSTFVANYIKAKIKLGYSSAFE